MLFKANAQTFGDEGLGQLTVSMRTLKNNAMSKDPEVFGHYCFRACTDQTVSGCCDLNQHSLMHTS